MSMDDKILLIHSELAGREQVTPAVAYEVIMQHGEPITDTASMSRLFLELEKFNPLITVTGYLEYREMIRAEIARQADEKRLAEALRNLAEIGATPPPAGELRGVVEKALSPLEKITTTAPFDFSRYVTDRVNYDPSRYFRPDTFQRLSFATGSLNYIGARTSRGKTAILVNLAREAVASGRRVVFLTAEMSPASIFDRTILNLFRASWPDDSGAHDITSTRWTDTMPSGYNTMTPINALLYHWLRVFTGKADRASERPALLEETFNAVRDHVADGVLQVVDVRGMDSEQIAGIIRTTSADVVLLDYVQKIRAPRGAENLQRQAQIQRVSGDLADVAVKSSKILICAAQFNRVSGGDPKAYDVFSDMSFRESGDLEQDADTALGLGWDKVQSVGSIERFYEVLKVREGAGVGDSYFMDTDMRYSYMNGSDRRYIQPRTDKQERETTSGKRRRGEVVEIDTARKAKSYV